MAIKLFRYWRYYDIIEDNVDIVDNNFRDWYLDICDNLDISQVKMDIFIFSYYLFSQANI